jgi:hypothetical protein
MGTVAGFVPKINLKKPLTVAVAGGMVFLTAQQSAATTGGNAARKIGKWQSSRSTRRNPRLLRSKADRTSG